MKSRSQIRGNDPASEDELKLCAVLQEVANELGGKYSLSNGQSIAGIHPLFTY